MQHAPIPISNIPYYTFTHTQHRDISYNIMYSKARYILSRIITNFSTTSSHYQYISCILLSNWALKGKMLFLNVLDCIIYLIYFYIFWLVGHIKWYSIQITCTCTATTFPPHLRIFTKLYSEISSRYSQNPSQFSYHTHHLYMCSCIHKIISL